MQIFKNYDLTKLNTFGISAKAKFFIELKNESELKGLFLSSEFKSNERLFLGGGSNVLFTKDFDGIVVLNRLKGIKMVKEDGFDVFVRSMGGEKWNDLVNFTVEKKLWGIENLALIPGTVGAAPMQNIGAYGVELKDVLVDVEAYVIEKGKRIVFQKEECKFGYRDSIFKNELKGKYFISAVTLKLSKEKKENIKYEILRDYLIENKIEAKKPIDISNAVSSIRRSKLPDPVSIPNAGSFFKNVYVEPEKLDEIKLKYPDVRFFEENGRIKIPAGWLIEKCGWKGKRIGNVGVHERQALVLVNYGGATGEEVKDLSEQIIASVYLKFGLTLEREVNLI